jgi:hypothetical protein
MTTDDDNEFIVNINKELSEEEISDVFMKRVKHDRLVIDTQRVYVLKQMPNTKSRFSWQLAQSLHENYGDMAHLHVLEKLSTCSPNSYDANMWRDALTYLDEIGENDVRGNTGDADRIGRKGEQSKLSETHSTNDAETTRPVSLHDGADGIGQ